MRASTGNQRQLDVAEHVHHVGLRERLLLQQRRAPGDLRDLARELRRLLHLELAHRDPLLPAPEQQIAVDRIVAEEAPRHGEHVVRELVRLEQVARDRRVVRDPAQLEARDRRAPPRSPSDWDRP